MVLLGPSHDTRCCCSLLSRVTLGIQQLVQNLQRTDTGKPLTGGASPVHRCTSVVTYCVATTGTSMGLHAEAMRFHIQVRRFMHEHIVA